MRFIESLTIHFNNLENFSRALIPSLASTPNVKISKAALLAKGAEYVNQLSKEKDELSREVEQLRNSVNDLNTDITFFQQQLPTAGRKQHQINSRFYNNITTHQVLPKGEQVLESCKICLIVM